MSFSFGFYNSINKDRRYDAIQVSQIFDGVISDGVYPTYGARFHVDKYSSNVIRIDSGRAWFDHTWNLNDGPEYREALPSDQYANRYDAIVIEVNSNPEVRRNELKWVRGPATSGGAPDLPVMADTEYIHQYPLAYVYRPAGINEIPDDGGVINNAGNPSCPWAMIYKSMVEIDPGEEGGAPSELEQHIIYNNDTLDFKASTLMQNGKPLKFEDKGKIESRVLYSNGYGNLRAVTFRLADSISNYDYVAIILNSTKEAHIFNVSEFLSGPPHAEMNHTFCSLDNQNQTGSTNGKFGLGVVQVSYTFEGTTLSLYSAHNYNLRFLVGNSALQVTDISAYSQTPVLISWNYYDYNNRNDADAYETTLYYPTIIGYKINRSF